MGANKIGVPGFASIFTNAGSVVSVGDGESYVIPVGWYYMALGADITLELMTDANTWTALYYTAGGDAMIGPYYSDGTNLRATNAGGQDEDLTLYAI